MNEISTRRFCCFFPSRLQREIDFLFVLSPRNPHVTAYTGSDPSSLEPVRDYSPLGDHKGSTTRALEAARECPECYCVLWICLAVSACCLNIYINRMTTCVLVKPWCTVTVPPHPPLSRFAAPCHAFFASPSILCSFRIGLHLRQLFFG